MLIQSGDDIVAEAGKETIDAAIAHRHQQGSPTATYHADGPWHVTGLTQNTKAYTAAIERFLSEQMVDDDKVTR